MFGAAGHLEIRDRMREGGVVERETECQNLNSGNLRTNGLNSSLDDEGRIEPDG